ncbi:hypothetical protein GUITHDRAFT_119670 [Guillardia theta CCMP2712]|uniref:Thioredoxin-like fold domain-containing protein n=1 Tax=Guillardia theta (strain CCMP2712) TaxID=905079 RepID=L1IDI7_GUITC|nr:hypothetical protein GUITHDRAFT_119670 [Guillardia theta CCMP2712]EKX34177.1 hypothetical protein GUITHDRAFT_119670 [Guillardia theta CCMP2712]|eukprot:XP_005821157.1 hypothetical protein GUITHDRAFT_119670 [Guillardia theta CCMP2712]
MASIVGETLKAHWCPQCREFDPELKRFYETVNGGGEKRFEIVFVSSEESEAATNETHNKYHGDWLAVPYGSSLRNELKRKFGVCAGKEQAAVKVNPRRSGIPTLLVLKEDGSELTIDGASEISSGVKAFESWLKASGR